MLIKYKSSYHKIAMGLLSYMPNGKDIKLLQELIVRYDTDPSWELYLYKEIEDFIGVIGIHHVENGDAELCHLCVNPSFREEGIGSLMVSEVMKKIQGFLLPSEQTKSFFLARIDENMKVKLEP